MMDRFDTAIEEIITRQFEADECDRQTKINMMIGKLCDMYRTYGQLEATNAVPCYREKLEDEIEMLRDDISKELYMLK